MLGDDASKHPAAGAGNSLPTRDAVMVKALKHEKPLLGGYADPDPEVGLRPQNVGLDLDDDRLATIKARAALPLRIQQSDSLHADIGVLLDRRRRDPDRLGDAHPVPEVRSDNIGRLDVQHDPPRVEPDGTVTEVLDGSQIVAGEQ